MSFTIRRREILGVLAALAFGEGTTPAMGQEADGIRYDQIPVGAYAVVAEVRAKPGKEDELRAITIPLIAKVRREPDNLLYFLHEGRGAPGSGGSKA